jgi:hypothetical protein
MDSDGILLDLSSLNSEQFEDLIEAIFRAKEEEIRRKQKFSTFHITRILRSGRGHDAGMDLLVTMLLSDCVATREFKWLVQCKHKAKSGASVGPRDFKGEFTFPDVVAEHDADGYLLVCSTRPGAKLQQHFNVLNRNRSSRYEFVCWDAARVCEELFNHPTVMEQFFPDDFRRTHRLMNKDDVNNFITQYGGKDAEQLKAALSDVMSTTKPKTRTN